MQARRTSERGFTLIELLVVIAILAVLFSILMPVFHSVREQGNMVQCMSNLRQLGTACRAYSDANQDKLIPLDYRDFSQPVDPNGYPETDGWPIILVTRGFLPFPPGATEWTDTMFRCPTGIFELRGITSVTTGMPTSRADADAQSGTHYSSHYLRPGLIIDVWYGVNGATDGDKTVPLQRVPPDSLPMTSAIWPTVFQVRHPADLVMIYDGLWANQMEVNANRVAARHLNHTITNVLFFDGHAESISTSSLPGGAGDANNPGGPTVTFGMTNLANYPFPKWRITQ